MKTLALIPARVVDGDGFSPGEVDLAEQHKVCLMWASRGKLYEIMRVTATHNDGYPTPVVTIQAPPAGIRLDVYDCKGRPIFTTKPRDTFEIGGPE